MCSKQYNELSKQCNVPYVRNSEALLSVYKWKNHFYEIKGDVGMSLHEKERNKKMPTPRHKVTHNPIPTSFFALTCCLFVCYECII